MRAVGRPSGGATAREAQWRLRADHLANFVRLHGRWPLRRSDDPDEKSLAWFLHNNAHATRGSGALAYALTPERVAYLDQVLPGWSENRNEAPDGAWLVRALAYAFFRQTNGLQPSSSSLDPNERDLSRWLSTERGRAEGSRTRLLDRLVPDWRTPRRAGRPRLDLWWQECADASIAYLETGTVAAGFSEERLRHWIRRQRTYRRGVGHRAHTLTAARSAYLSRARSNWYLVPLPAHTQVSPTTPRSAPGTAILAAADLEIPTPFSIAA